VILSSNSFGEDSSKDLSIVSVINPEISGFSSTWSSFFGAIAPFIELAASVDKDSKTA
jgi:hypothetical protein